MKTEEKEKKPQKKVPPWLDPNYSLKDCSNRRIAKIFAFARRKGEKTIKLKYLVIG